MLDGLDQVDWDRLGHAYGAASDVPEQLRTLRSPNAELRERARWQLYGNIFHQGTRYEATAYAVPFLLELLADAGTPERTELTRLLTSLAIGYDESWLPEGMDLAYMRGGTEGAEALVAEGRRRLAEAVEEDDEEADEEEEEEFYTYLEFLNEDEEERLQKYINERAYDAVRTGVPVFVQLLREDDPALRVAAAHALAWFPEEASTIVGPLAEATGDPDEVAATTAVVALGLIGADVPSAVLSDERPLVAFGTALALARNRGTEAGEEAVQRLIAMTRAEDTEREGFPFMYGDLGGYASLALREVAPDGDGPAFEALLDRLAQVSGTEALPVLSEALRRAFPDGPPPAGTPYSGLSGPQQALARRLADSPDTWLLNGMSFGNFALMLREFHLPGEHDKLTAYVTVASGESPG